VRVLVTGGAGYIGSHTVRCLLQEGHEVTVLDDLRLGHRQAVPVEIIEADLTDREAVRVALSSRRFEAVLHFAALMVVAESVQQPQKYFFNNVAGSINLLDAMLTAKIPYLVFSSTSEVYGEAQVLPLTEDHPKDPTNPYGESKWMVERILRRYSDAYGLRSVALRYFNAAGAAEDGSLGEDHADESHLIPNAVLGALGVKPFQLTCSQVDTPDGTTIRDYVHVDDLARAHTLALDSLASGHASDAYNVGVGTGYSTKQVIDAVQRVSGVKFEVGQGTPRAGEPAARWAASEKIKRELGWAPKHDLESIVATAWRWHEAHPRGFGS